MIEEKITRKSLQPNEDGSYLIYKTDYRVFYILLSTLIFTIAGLYFYKSGNSTLSTAFFVSFVISSIISLKIVLMKKPVLIIEEDHIMIYPIIGGAETILWEDIKGFREIRKKNDQFIAVFVNDPEAVLESQNDKLTYKIMRQYYKQYNTPYLFQSKALNAHSKEILNLLNDKLSEFYNRGMI